MHLAIATRDFAPGVQNDGRIMVEAGRTTLEDRCDQRDPEIRRLLREGFGRRPRNLLGPIEAAEILALAEIRRPKQLRQTDDLRAIPHGVLDPVLGVAEVPHGIGLTAHLHQTDATGSGRSLGIVLCHPELG